MSIQGIVVRGKFGRKKRIPGKSLVTVGKSFEKQNRPIAEIILADQLTYYGLPVIWARLWMKNHPPGAKKAKRVEAVQESLW
jgi:hypothetical protein